MKRVLVLAVAVGAVWAAASAANAAFVLTDDDRVVFYGGQGVEPPTFGLQVETFVRVRYPRLKTWFLGQRPQPGGTAAEGDAQFDPHVAAWKPTVVVLCFGLDDPARQKLDPGKLDLFTGSMRKLIEKSKTLGARVWVMTPPCPEVSADPRLAEIQYDECVGQYAEALRKLAKEMEAPVVDWYQASVDYRTASASNARLRLTTGSGVEPSPLGAAVATNLILRAWQAEPLKFTIRADWSGDTAEVSAGQIEVTRKNENTLILSLKDVPLPWYAADRGGILASDWPPTPFYEYTLQIENVPEGGFIISESVGGKTRGGKPFLSKMLREGWDISNVGPMTGTKALTDLYGAIDRKNQSYQRLGAFRQRPSPDPELKEAYETQALAFRQYADGTARIVPRMPRSTDIVLQVQTAQAAAEEARATLPPTTQPASQPAVRTPPTAGRGAE